MISLIIIIWSFSLSISFEDYSKYLEGAQAILNGQNPYHEGISESYYPPLQFIIYALILCIFGESMLSFRLGVLLIHIIDTILIYILFKTIINQNNKLVLSHETPQKRSTIEITHNCIILSYFDQEKIPFYASILYALYPLIINRVLGGSNDGFPNFFFILGLICFIKNKHSWTGIWFACALLIKLTTLFIYPWIFIYFFKRKEYKTILIYGFYSICIIFVVFLPFLLNNSLDSLNGMIRLFQKPTWETRYDQIFFKGTTYNDSFLYTIQLQIFGEFTISLWAIIQISLYLTILVNMIQMQEDFRPIIFFKGCGIIYCALPLLTLGVGARYYYWAVPILLIIFFYDHDYFVLIFPVFLFLISLLAIKIINPTELFTQWIWFIILMGLNVYQVIYIFMNKKRLISDSFRY